MDQGYLGTNYGVPTDANSYLAQVGLSALSPQAFNADTLAGMFSPQGMSWTPANNMATNPFLSQFMQSSAQELKLPQRKTGLEALQPGQQDQGGMGMGY